MYESHGIVSGLFLRQMYLMQFGYLPASDLETGALRTEAELRRAIRHFQRVANVRQTGRLDAATVAAMKRPRCGMADLLTAGHWAAPAAQYNRTHRHGHGGSWTAHGPAQEYAFGPSKWHKTSLTYRCLFILSLRQQREDFYID